MKLQQPCEERPKLTSELEDARHELIEVAEQRLVAQGIVRALASRLLDRHDDLRRVRQFVLQELDHDGMIGPVRPRQRPLSHVLDKLDATLDEVA